MYNLLLLISLSEVLLEVSQILMVSLIQWIAVFESCLELHLDHLFLDVGAKIILG